MISPEQNATATPPQPAVESAGAQPDTGDQTMPGQNADAAPPAVEAAAETEAGAPTPPTAEETIAQLQDELALAQARADEYLDRLQRTAAEYQNSRRRQEKQLSEQIERASLHILQRLIPVLDDLDLAFRNVPAELAGVAAAGAEAQTQVAWVDGFRQIQRKLHALVDEQGVEPIPVQGPFDPTRHQAISSEPSDQVASGHIVETLRVGYEHRGHVLRPALVRIAT